MISPFFLILRNERYTHIPTVILYIPRKYATLERSAPHEFVGSGLVVQIAAFAVQEVRVGLPDLLEHPAVHDEALATGRLEAQPLVDPHLPKVAVQRVRLPDPNGR